MQGGWTTETAQSCTDHPHLRQTLLAWLHAHATATSGPARRRGLWRTHRLVCLDKGGGAIRPILIGMMWAKLLSHLLLQPAKSDLEPFFAAQTIWDRNPPGGTGDDHGNQSPSCPASRPCGCMSRLQKCMFGSINRTTCVEALRELCPHHPAWLDAVNVLLSEPVLVVNPAENHLAMTYDGLPPGGPPQHFDLLAIYDRGPA